MLVLRSTLLLSFAYFSLRCSIAFSILFLPLSLFCLSLLALNFLTIPQYLRLCRWTSNTAVIWEFVRHTGSRGPTSDLLSQSLSFNNMPRWFIYMVKLQKHYSNFLPLAIFSKLCSLYSCSDPKLRVTILNRNSQIYSSDHEFLPSFFNKLLNICYGFSMDNVSCSKEVLISSLCSFFLITINEHFPRHLGL